MFKAIVLQNFATIGIPDFDGELGKNWNIIALSDQLIDQNRLNGLQHLNTRRLDLVIHNGTKFGLLNLQAFKIFDCPLATDSVQQCLAYHLTSDGSLLFGIQPSGDILILTEGLQKTKNVKIATFINFLPKPSKWYVSLPTQVWEYFTGSTSKTNQVSSEQTQKTSSSWWKFLPFTSPTSKASTSTHSTSPSKSAESLPSHFPYITALPDGLAVFCAFSPENCYVFLPSYETALRNKSIANFQGSRVPGRWHRIIMHKNFITTWLQNKKCEPWFEAKLCYYKQDGVNRNVAVGGAMVYAVQEGKGIELVYGIIKRRGEKFTLSWEKVQFEVDWIEQELDTQYSLELRFAARLSSDCKKIAVVISTNLGMYANVLQIPDLSNGIIHLSRKTCSLCNHSDYDGVHFYKKDCWITDVQWLVEDAFIACLTLCGSLSILYADSSDPMIVKVRKPGAEFDESKSARFFFPVFHPKQVNTSELSMKWIDSQKILTCSSGMKIELFSIQRVMNLATNEEEVVLESTAKLVEDTSHVAPLQEQPCGEEGKHETTQDVLENEANRDCVVVVEEENLENYVVEDG